MRSGLVQWALVQAFYCLHVVTLTAYAIGAQGLEQDLGLSSVQMGSLSAAFFVAFGLSQLLIGAQLGSRPNRWLIGGSALVATLGCLLLVVSHSFAMALAARVLMGAGVGNALVSTVHVVSERFPERFPLMTNISQGLANLSGAAIGLAVPLVPALGQLKVTFHWGFILLLIDTALIFAFCQNGQVLHRGDQAAGPRPDGVFKRVRSILKRPQFWSSMAFFAGLFGSFLSFAESWNIQFQIDVFHQKDDIAPLINSAVIVGLAVGSIGSGAIADRKGFCWPARIGAAVTLAMMLVLASDVLPVWIAVISQGLLGLGMGTASLGLTSLRGHVPKEDFSLASSLMLTGVFISAGVLSAAVGWSATDLALAKTGFMHYQQALSWLVAFAAMACVASLTMRPPESRSTTSIRA